MYSLYMATVIQFPSRPESPEPNPPANQARGAIVPMPAPVRKPLSIRLSVSAVNGPRPVVKIRAL